MDCEGAEWDEHDFDTASDYIYVGLHCLPGKLILVYMIPSSEQGNVKWESAVVRYTGILVQYLLQYRVGKHSISCFHDMS